MFNPKEHIMHWPRAMSSRMVRRPVHLFQDHPVFAPTSGVSIFSRQACVRRIGLAGCGLVILMCLGSCVPFGEPPKELYELPEQHGSQSAPTPSTVALRQCLRNLDNLGVRYIQIADRSDRGCELRDAVLVRSVGSVLVPQVTLGCPAAGRLALWITKDLVPLSQAHLGQEAVSIGTMGSYVCRSVVGIADNRLSEHAFGNAVDLAAVRLADGRRIAIASGWQGNARDKAFWRALRDAACRRFNVVLSPDYNAAHFNHLHFDMGNRKGCR